MQKESKLEKEIQKRLVQQRIDHKVAMIDITERENNLKDVPFIDDIPFVFDNSRNCIDVVELNFYLGFACGFPIGVVFGFSTYANAMNLRRILKAGILWGSIPVSILSVIFGLYFNPFCQYPNRGNMKLLTYEAKVKNHFDEKFNYYENAHYDFLKRRLKRKYKEEK